MKTFKCDNCKRTITNDSDFTTGYGTNREDEKICFECIGFHDKQKLRSLKPGEFMWLYFAKDRLINWPGSFELRPTYVRKGSHNIARERIDAWFKFNHHHYHGVNIGDNQCMKVTRLKK